MNLDKYKNYTIAFEIELESKDNYIHIPSHFYNVLKPYGKQDDSEEKKLLEDKRKYSEIKIKENLPNFYNKYNDELKYTFDKTLVNGIEIANKTYCLGIYEAIELISTFFNDFKNQSFWTMEDNTSIHINIGVNDNIEWNISKGLLAIDDDYIFKGIQENRRYKYKNILENVDMNENIDEQILLNLKKYGPKAFNLNINRIIEDDYAEFRYIGGKVDFDTVKEKMIYFCNIVDIMKK